MSDANKKNMLQKLHVPETITKSELHCNPIRIVCFKVLYIYQIKDEHKQLLDLDLDLFDFSVKKIFKDKINKKWNGF